MGTCCLSFGHLLKSQRETFELMRPYCHPEMPHCFTIHYFITNQENQVNFWNVIVFNKKSKPGMRN